MAQPQLSNRISALSSFYPLKTKHSSPAIKQPQQEVNHSLPPISEVKNAIIIFNIIIIAL
jgi:hypothetical protein